MMAGWGGRRWQQRVVERQTISSRTLPKNITMKMRCAFFQLIFTRAFADDRAQA
jgi:hypothetical protein